MADARIPKILCVDIQRRLTLGGTAERDVWFAMLSVVAVSGALPLIQEIDRVAQDWTQ